MYIDSRQKQPSQPSLKKNTGHPARWSTPSVSIHWHFPPCRQWSNCGSGMLHGTLVGTTTTTTTAPAAARGIPLHPIQANNKMSASSMKVAVGKCWVGNGFVSSFIGRILVAWINNRDESGSATGGGCVRSIDYYIYTKHKRLYTKYHFITKKKYIYDASKFSIT